MEFDDHLNKSDELPTSIILFSYGSNSLAQLRGRISPPVHQNECAKVVDYERVFAGFSSSWGGGAASLYPREGSRTLGSITSLTTLQLKELSVFEGGYELRKVDVINESNQERISAYTFIKKDSNFINLPSEAYLAAIHCHLIEVCAPSSIEIVGYSQRGRIVMDEGWRYPDSHTQVGIPAFLVIANTCRVSRGLSSWQMPAAMVEATTALENIGVHSVNDLSVALHNVDNFKQLLLSVSCTLFDEDTVATLTDLLLPAAIVGPDQLECADGDEGLIFLFVYGSLLSGLHNFPLLERSSAVYMGPAGTSEEYYLCARGPGFSFPYVTKQEVIPGQTRTRVKGEVYKVPIQHVPELDRLENHPHWYRRQEIQVLQEEPERNNNNNNNNSNNSTTQKAWIYILENQDDIDEMKSKPNVFHDVSHGDWKRFLRENSKN